MDTKALPGVRKAKKKQVKDELDRNKQAEKKKRRLEKALATSAAIRSELEKKKQMKKEEQQRLDEEGAAIAEAVALNVLLGEDSDEPCQIMLKENDGFNHWNHSSNVDIFMGGRISGVSHQNIAKAKCSFDGVGWVSNAHGSIYDWNSAGNCAWLPVASRPFARNIRGPFFEDGGWGASEISAGISAAQALSSLQIAEDSDLDTIVFVRKECKEPGE